MSKKGKKLLEIAAGEIGVKENPPNSNNQKYGEWYGMNNEPWCAIFVSWLYHQADIDFNLQTSKGFHSVPGGYDNFKKVGKIFQEPEPGDVIFFDFNRNGYPEHTGIIAEKIGKTSFISIEGNTSKSSDDNGGSVMRRQRYVKDCLGFGRVYPQNDYENHKYKESIVKAKDRGIMVGDPNGDFRPDEFLTRGEFSIIANFLYDMIEKNKS